MSLWAAKAADESGAAFQRHMARVLKHSGTVRLMALPREGALEVTATVTLSVPDAGNHWVDGRGPTIEAALEDAMTTVVRAGWLPAP